MHITVTEDMFHDAFIRYNRKDNFTPAGRTALYTFLTELEEDTGEPMQLDVIALCCDYQEYATLEQFNQDRGSDYKSWYDVNEDSFVIEHSNGSAIVGV